jgi:hypothetical protein
MSIEVKRNCLPVRAGAPVRARNVPHAFASIGDRKGEDVSARRHWMPAEKAGVFPLRSVTLHSEEGETACRSHSI